MNWLYNRNYVGPDRRRGGFGVRFLDRRKEVAGGEPPASPLSMLGAFFREGRKWVDALSYFGPDRRSGAFSHFILERRKKNAASTPPPLRSALRQLRVRTLGAELGDQRRALQERLTATAVLAAVQGRTDVADILVELAQNLEGDADDALRSDRLRVGLLRAEATLDGA